ALLEIEDRDFEGRHRLRPFDAGLVVERLDDGGDQTRHAHSIGAAMDRPFDTIGAGHHCLHRFGIFGPEIEDLADLDATGMQALLRWNVSLESQPIVNVLGRGIRALHRPKCGRQCASESIASSGMGRSSTSLLQKTPDSPVSARMMNSCERSPPMGPVSAAIGMALRPIRAKVRR